MKNRSFGRLTVSILLAFFFAVCASGLVLALGITSAPLALLMFISPMLCMFLYGFGGLIPSVVMLASLEALSFFFLGSQWAIGVFLAVVLPSAEMIYSSSKGMKFFKQLRCALAAQALGIVLMLGAMVMIYGPNLGAVAGDYLRETVMSFGEEARQALAEVVRQIYAAMKLEIIVDDSELLDLLIAEFEQMFKVSAPLVLVSITGYNAAIGVLWGNWLRARHGEDKVQYVSLDGWRLPASTTLAVLVMLVLTYALTYTGSVECEMVYNVVLSVISLLCLSQASASILSRMKRSGTTAGKRTVIFIALLVFLNIYLVFYGALSALFGSQGLVTKALKERMDKKTQDKGDQ